MRPPDDLPDLTAQFLAFAKGCRRDGAPLYGRICEGVAGDEELLSLTATAPAEQRRPNLLLAAVHYLLLAGIEDPLADHYPTVADRRGPRGASDPFDDFATFCRRHGPELRALLANRATQTNEIGRCSALLPAFVTVASTTREPLALVDLGASAGLNLLFDRYRYEYGEDRSAGPVGSPVTLRAELRSGDLPELVLPSVRSRVGVDERPVDPSDDDAARWLLACQWPDHVERFRRLRGALDLARETTHRPPVIRGDIVDDLPRVAAGIPADAHLCLFHTWVAAYLSPERQRALAATIAEVARDRPVSWVFAENPYEVPGLPLPPAPDGQVVKGATALVLVALDGRAAEPRRLADMHPHGRWLHWWGPKP